LKLGQLFRKEEQRLMMYEIESDVLRRQYGRNRDETTGAIYITGCFIIRTVQLVL
jgi:hypothetical protein